MLVFLIILVTGDFIITKRCEILKNDTIHTDNTVLDITAIRTIKIINYQEVNDKVAELI